MMQYWLHLYQPNCQLSIENIHRIPMRIDWNFIALHSGENTLLMYFESTQWPSLPLVPVMEGGLQNSQMLQSIGGANWSNYDASSTMNLTICKSIGEAQVFIGEEDEAVRACLS